MSVLNRPLFRRGFANGGFAELRDRPVRELFSGIGGLQAAPDDFARGPMAPEALRQTEQMLSDPRAARGGQNFDVQLQALEGMSLEQLADAPRRGFDPALAQRVAAEKQAAVESERGEYASPLGRAASGIGSLIAGAGDPWTVRSQIDRYREYVGKPFARVAEWAVTPQYANERTTFMEALRGPQDPDAETPPPNNPYADVRERRGEAGTGQADVPFVTVESEDDVPVVDADGRVSTPRPQAGSAATPAAPRDDLLDAYEGRSDLYDQVLGSSEERRQQARSRIMFDIAQRALAFAGGVTPEGQRTSGSVVSQAAQAFAGAPATVAAESRALQDQEQAMRVARLQQAEKEVGEQAAGAQDFARRLALLRAEASYDAAAEGRAPDFNTVVSAAREAAQEGEAAVGADRINVRKAFDTGSYIRQVANQAGSLANVRPSPETDNANRYVKLLNTTLTADIARILSDANRSSNFQLQLALEHIPQPNTLFSTLDGGIASYGALRDALELQIRDLRRDYSVFQGDKDEQSKIASAAGRLASKQQQLDTFLSGLRGQKTPEDGEQSETVVSTRRDMGLE
jgi:hypothetical protein